MTRTAFKHQNPGKDSLYPRCTVALDLPAKDELINMIKLGVSVLPMEVGYTQAHPKDQFVKAIGRDIAYGNKTLEFARLASVTMRDRNRVVFEFSVSVVDRSRVGFATNKECPPELEMVIGISFVPEVSHCRLEYLYVV